MSDQATSGEPTAAPATAPTAASAAAPAGETRPIGSFGTARGSGLARGKRATTAAAAPAAPSAGIGGYKPSSVEVITSKSEYVNPFTGETTVSASVNEPAPQAASPNIDVPVDLPDRAAADVAPQTEIPTGATTPAPIVPAKEMFPFTPSAANEPKPGSPQPQPERSRQSADSPAESSVKAEIKILPPADAKRPAVSWGDGTHDEDTRPQRDQRPTFQPERREPRKFEAHGQKPFEPREAKPFQPREPRREPALEQRGPLPRNGRDLNRTETPKKSGGFIGWLKGLFAGKSTVPAPAQPSQRDGQNRDAQYGDQRRRHRGGRGRGGYQGQGENRGAREQPRDPRDEPQGGYGSQGGEQSHGQGERRYEGGGGGGRRRRRGGRGRNRDDHGGPRSEGQQGGGAI